jgi:hypothetical protein
MSGRGMHVTWFIRIYAFLGQATSDLSDDFHLQSSVAPTTCVSDEGESAHEIRCATAIDHHRLSRRARCLLISSPCILTESQTYIECSQLLQNRNVDPSSSSHGLLNALGLDLTRPITF